MLYCFDCLALVLSRALSVLLSFFISFSGCVGYQGQDFDWADYLKQCEAEAAPQHCFPTVSWAHYLFNTHVITTTIARRTYTDDVILTMLVTRLIQ